MYKEIQHMPYQIYIISIFDHNISFITISMFHNLVTNTSQICFVKCITYTTQPSK